MKNRKKFIGIVLLIVVLALGIAYAATTIDLTITGSASASFSDLNHKVAFTGTTTESGSGTIDAAATNGATSATLKVSGLTTKGDKATAIFEVKNSSVELESAIAVATATISNTEYFKITTSIPDDGKVLSPEEVTNVTVVVELLKSPVADITATIDVDLTATAQVATQTTN